MSRSPCIARAVTAMTGRLANRGIALIAVIVALGIAAVTSAVMPAPADGAPSLVAMSNSILLGQPVIDIAVRYKAIDKPANAADLIFKG